MTTSKWVTVLVLLFLSCIVVGLGFAMMHTQMQIWQNARDHGMPYAEKKPVVLVVTLPPGERFVQFVPGYAYGRYWTGVGDHIITERRLGDRLSPRRLTVYSTGGDVCLYIQEQ